MDAHPDTADVATWLREARRQLAASGGPGARYAAKDVDAFFSGVAAELDSGVAPDAKGMRAAKFRVARMGKGYPMREVDELIDGLELRLAGADLSSSDTDPRIARIDNARFSTGRGREGYDEREVDEFLHDVAEALRSGEQPPPPPLFTTTRLRPGYDKREVDAFLREVWPVQ